MFEKAVKAYYEALSFIEEEENKILSKIEKALLPNTKKQMINQIKKMKSGETSFKPKTIIELNSDQNNQQRLN